MPVAGVAAAEPSWLAGAGSAGMVVSSRRRGGPRFSGRPLRAARRRGRKRCRLARQRRIRRRSIERIETKVVANRSAGHDVPEGMRYARSGDAHVAYDVLGTGPTDVLIVNESMLPIEALHENVFTASFLVRLGTWAR